MNNNYNNNNNNNNNNIFPTFFFQTMFFLIYVNPPMFVRSVSVFVYAYLLHTVSLLTKRQKSTDLAKLKTFTDDILM